MTLTSSDIYTRLRTVMDPELNIDIVSLGLIYDVKVIANEQAAGISGTSGGEERVQQNPAGMKRVTVDILMTLTTPGCPLAGTFDQLLRGALTGLPGIDPDEDIRIELTFDPPWVPDMMSEEARAELGFD